MKLSQFRYNLPQELIALYPAENRDESRLLVVNRKTGTFEHKVFKEITELSGRKFDPEIVEIFFECIDVIKSIREKYPEAE